MSKAVEQTKGAFKAMFFFAFIAVFIIMVLAAFNYDLEILVMWVANKIVAIGEWFSNLEFIRNFFQA